MNIIVYPPGSGGNLVSAVIDSKNCYYRNGHFETYRRRLRVKSDMESMSDEDKDNYITKMGNLFLSVPSHVIDYHIKRNHDFILIAPVTDIEINWCINRFSKIHPDVKQLVQGTESSFKEFVTNGKKHTDKVITVEEIYTGKLIERLKEYVSTPLDTHLYDTWLEADINQKPKE